MNPAELLKLSDHPSLISADFRNLVAVICLEHEDHYILTRRLRGKLRIIYSICEECQQKKAERIRQQEQPVKLVREK